MEEQITNLLETYFETEPEFADCFVVAVNHSNKKVEAFVDADSGMTFQKCQRISRYLEAWLDEEQPLGDKYILEVSSPGIDRPLKFFRQYRKNVGRTLQVTTTDGDEYTGVLKSADPGQLVLEAKVRELVGKRKKTVVKEVEIDFDAIKKAMVKVVF